MPPDSLTVLVVDDTILYRKVVSDILASIPDVKVVGTAADGKIAIWRIETLSPDLVILDVEMPNADGLEVLQHIKDKGLATGAVMLSSLTYDGSKQTIRALELGAFDFITKPQTSSFQESRQAIQRDLTRVVEAFIRHKQLRSAIAQQPMVQRPQPSKPAAVAFRPQPRPSLGPSSMVLIGVSTGGPNALKQVLPRLPADLGVPVLIVQHMPPVFTRSLAESLDTQSQLSIMEAQDGQPIKPNLVLIAPGGRQMGIRPAQQVGHYEISITDDPPENGCRPSVDYLFRSVAEVYGGAVTAVIMTGMGCDGKAGLMLLKQKGALSIAQDQATSVVYGMPKEVIEAGLADLVAPLEQIPELIVKSVRHARLAIV